MVYDRETGAMRTLLVSPFPRSFLLVSKLLGGVAVAAIQAYVFLGIFYFWEAELSDWGYPLLLAPPALLCAAAHAQLRNRDVLRSDVMQKVDGARRGRRDRHHRRRHLLLAAFAALDELSHRGPCRCVISGLMLGSLALFMSSVIKQLENFAGVMNFVIFPMFFASSALYPLWRIKESSLLLYQICCSTLSPTRSSSSASRFTASSTGRRSHRRRPAPRCSSAPDLRLQPIKRPDRPPGRPRLGSVRTMLKSKKSSAANTFKLTVSSAALAAVLAFGAGSALHAQTAPAAGGAAAPAEVKPAPELAPGLAPGVVPGARPGGVEDAKPAPSSRSPTGHRAWRRAWRPSRRHGGRSGARYRPPGLHARRGRYPGRQRRRQVLAGRHHEQPRLAVHSAQGAAHLAGAGVGRPPDR